MKAIIQVNERCNLDCGFCNKHSSVPEKLGLEDLKNLLDWGLDAVTLVGGEAALHPRIGEIINLFKGNDIDVTMQTNGTVFNPSILEADALAISLDGLYRTHNKNRATEEINAYSRALDLLLAITHLNNREPSPSSFMELGDEGNGGTSSRPVVGSRTRTKLLNWNHLPNPKNEAPRVAELIREIREHGTEPPNIGLRLTYHKNNLGEVVRLCNTFNNLLYIGLFPLLGEPRMYPSDEELAELYAFAMNQKNVEILQPSWKQFNEIRDYGPCPAGKKRFGVYATGEVVDCYWNGNYLGKITDSFDYIRKSGEKLRNRWSPQLSCLHCDRYGSCKGSCKVSLEYQRCPLRQEVSAKELINISDKVNEEAINQTQAFLENNDFVEC